MFEAISKFISPYVTVLLVSTGISFLSLVGLRFTSIRSYRRRTWAILVPLTGSFLLALSISPSCFAHWLSMGILDHVRLICVGQTFAFVRLLCTSWVTLTSISFSMAGALGVLSFYFSGWTVKKLYGYQEVEEEEIGDLYNGINEISEKADIITPRIFLLESSSPKIFSHGGYGDPSIFISVGLLETLSQDEILASVGHEIAHIKNRDTLVRSLAVSLKIATMFNPVGFLLEPVLARDHEFLADEEGARLSGRLRGLISALVKLSQITPSGVDNLLMGDLLLNLFMPGKSKWRMLSRHPPLDERVRRLLDFARATRQRTGSKKDG